MQQRNITLQGDMFHIQKSLNLHERLNKCILISKFNRKHINVISITYVKNYRSPKKIDRLFIVLNQ